MIVRIFAGLVLLSVAPTFAIAGQFTTVLGGTYPPTVSAIATDSSGNTYVVGSTQLPGTPSFVNSSVSAQAHVIVAKLDPNGNVLFTDTFAGQGVDAGTAIAVDPAGNIYIAGTTTSADFPLSNPLQTRIFPAGTVNGLPAGSGFIIKLSNDGTTVLYSTLFGGTLGQSAVTSLATDANGVLYLTGYTQASDFPHTPGMPIGTITQTPAVPGAILASISAAGDKILYSGVLAMPTPCPVDDPSCIGNGPSWEGVGIAVDAAGNAYVAGNDQSYTNLPTTAGVLAPNGIGAFVAKINAGGTGLGYLTYLGSGSAGGPPFGSAENIVYAIAVDAAGNAYLAGQSDDPKFPATTGSYQSSAPVSSQSNFAAKLNPTGSALVWATYLAAAQAQSPPSIALDADGDVWITGTASSSVSVTTGLPSVPFPNANGWTSGPEYLGELNPTGSQLTYSALYPSGTMAQAVAVDPSGIVHTAGSAGFISAMAPTAAPSVKIFALENVIGYTFSARVSPAEVIAIYGPGIGPAAPVSAAPANRLYPTKLGGVQVSVNGVDIPLLYVSANQINAVVPMELPIDGSATFQVTNGSAVSPNYPAWIVAGSPEAFATVINQDGTLNSQSNPALGGSTVSLFVTGWQSNFAPLADGQIATTMRDACLGACTAAASMGSLGPPIGCCGFPFVTEGVTSLPATALYGGAAPGFVAGVTQFNVQLGTAATPPTTATAAYSLSVGTPDNFITSSVWITP